MNIIEGIQKEVVRVREIIEIYKETGPAGALAVMLMSNDVVAAEKAVATGDTVAMISEYSKLKEWEL